MKKLDERSPWEKEWASAFEDASLQPSESVWHSIDGELANKEAQKYKKRAFFYQWAAAASFLLACCSIAFILLKNAPERQEVARQDSLQDTRQNIPAEEAAPTAMDAVPFSGIAGTEEGGARTEGTAGDTNSMEEAEQYNAAEAAGKRGNQRALAGSEPAGRQEQRMVKAGGADNGGSTGGGMAPEEASSESNALAGLFAGEEDTDAEKGNMALAAVVPQGISSLSFIEQGEEKPAPVEANIQKVWLASDMLKKSSKESNPRYLLGASIASNYFNPNFQENTPALAGFAADAARPAKGNLTSTANLGDWQEEKINQPSVNAGIQAAGWIAKKWVLQAGVQYGNYRSSTMAGSYMDAVTAQAYPLHYANFSPDKIQRVSAGSRLAAPVSAINTFEFISVPLKLGYMVLDKKVGLLLSPGISSEIFLRNQLTDANNQLSTYTIYGGEEAPFNRLHFRGMMGAQIFYKLSEHYMISLEPNYQHSITDFNKEGTLFQSRPSNMGISAGFRYIIR